MSLTSLQRPLPLAGRADLRCERIAFDGSDDWIVKDPVSLQYYRMIAQQYRLLQLLDGRRTLEEIYQTLRAEFSAFRFGLHDVRQLIADLHRKGLVWSSRPGQSAVLLKEKREDRRRKLFSSLANMLYIRLPGWDPERFLRRLEPWTAWMFHPAAVFASMLLVLSAWLLLAMRAGQFQRQMPEFSAFFTWPNLVYLWFTIGATKVVHELGHALTCRRFGGECHEIGVSFLLFSPCMYCDVSDSWMLPEKRRRILISAAGMYVEVVISALALFVWWNTSPGLLHYLSLNTFLVTTVTTVIFNINPLLRYDGYYMLADWLEIPNLRGRASSALQDRIVSLGLGIRSPSAESRGRTAWLSAFALASAVYRWTLLVGIGAFLWHALKPYGLSSLSLVYFAAAVIGGSASSGLGLVRKVQSLQPQKAKPWRLAFSAMLVVGLVCAVMLIPVPVHVVAPLSIEARESRPVYSGVRGRLRSLEVRPGESIAAGQTLVQLENAEVELKLIELETRRDRHAAELTAYQKLRDAGQEALVREARTTLAGQLDELRANQERLTVRASESGIVLTSAFVRAPSTHRKNFEPRPWHGHPGDEQNLGCLVEEASHLFTIAPTNAWDAVLIVEQADSRALEPGERVQVKLEAFPGRTFSGQIRQIASRHDTVVPESLSSRYGGGLPTVTGPDGKELLRLGACQVRVALDADPAGFRQGMRGTARLEGEERTIGQWILWHVQRTFLFGG
jgi:putative peptide zinc metalloprotease protein